MTARTESRPLSPAEAVYLACREALAGLALPRRWEVLAALTDELAATDPARRPADAGMAARLDLDALETRLTRWHLEEHGGPAVACGHPVCRIVTGLALPVDERMAG